MSLLAVHRVVLAAVLLTLLFPAAAPAQSITEFHAGITPGIPPGPLSATPYEIAAGPDGNVWFTEFNAARVGRITPAGAITEYSAGITSQSEPYGITAGPDGNVWFTELRGHIGRITPAGVVTEFPVRLGTAGIAAGRDGNLWFTANTSNVVGRITPAGEVTEYSDNITAPANPEGIAAGPDGNLWFTEMYGDRIGRITPAGAITEFSGNLTPGAQPVGIAAGPDGNVWFTELIGDRIGRITPAGVVTEFSAGISPDAEPDGITAGPDGNLWFTEDTGHRIGRITPAGVVTEFSAGITPGGAQLIGIAAGPDGNLWFTEQNFEQIGRLIPERVAPPPVPVLPPVADRDRDGVSDATDDCPDVANAGQGDADRDGVGDACDVLPPGDRPPVAGVSTVVGLLSGDVRVKLPGTTGFVPLVGLASIPVGSVIDARKGALTIRSAANRAGTPASATVRAGIFRIRQARARGRQVVPAGLELVSAAGAEKRCAGGPPKGIVRALSVTAKGLFRTVAGAAIVKGRNAAWTTTDRCDGTLTRVVKGRVAVLERSGGTTRTVRAGHSLLIRARLFASKQRRPR